MSHTIVKLGGSVLGGPLDAPGILEILGSYPGPLVLVVSALRGLTDALIRREREGGESGSDRAWIGEIVERHRAFAAAFAPDKARLEAIGEDLALLGDELATVLAGSAPDRKARILSFGERLAAAVMPAAFAAQGRDALVIEPGDLGLVAAGEGEDAHVDRELAWPRIRSRLETQSCAVVPGFFGLGEDGLVRLFGRGGSDYSAAVIAAAVGAEACVLAKDASCILTADPRIVPEARPVKRLSYREAAELARGGAKVIHPRAVEPLEEAGVPLLVIGVAGRRDGTFVSHEEGAVLRTGVDVAPRPQSPPATRLDPPDPRQRPRSVPARRGRVRAIALASGPEGLAALTLAGEGASRSDLGPLLAALERAQIGPWSIHGGEGAASIRIMVPTARGGDALKVLHAALFGERAGRATRKAALK